MNHQISLVSASLSQTAHLHIATSQPLTTTTTTYVAFPHLSFFPLSPGQAKFYLSVMLNPLSHDSPTAVMEAHVPHPTPRRDPEKTCSRNRPVGSKFVIHDRVSWEHPRVRAGRAGLVTRGSRPPLVISNFTIDMLAVEYLRR